MDWITGYCTNIHAGPDLTSLRSNLVNYSAEVQRLVTPARDLGVGLWVANDAASQLASDDKELASLAALMRQLSLLPYTINGFPFGNFHQPVVKHRVYEPTWWSSERLDYTRLLVRILSQLLPAEAVGSISTLPIAWGSPSDEELAAAANSLNQLARELLQHEETTGQRIVIAIEPEPGCYLDTSSDVISFFERFVPDSRLRRYLTVCHDICHAAVMFEPQAEVLQRYWQHGITVGKIQVSSAITVPWQQMDAKTHEHALAQLRQFAEDRYLHQTGVINQRGDFSLCVDLPKLLQRDTPVTDQAWRIHFHVPIFLDSFGALHSTRDAISDCLQAYSAVPEEHRVNHLEVETYAWSVLPEEMRAESLPQCIAKEMSWLQTMLKRIEQ
jgi:sugar phosphate isomerase/epimerase